MIDGKKSLVPGWSSHASMQNQANVSRRILAVDDDLYIREIITRTLIGGGYEVDTAKDGASAWTVLNQTSYDLLITDHKMPRVTGVELIKKLRSIDMELPVILMSGTLPTDELKRHPWLRIDAMLPKPFTVEELLDMVKKIVGAVDGRTPNSQLFRDCAMLESKISQTEKPATIAPVRDQMNFSHRILVVDDDNDTRQLSVDMLAESGYDVESVNDGAAGWKEIQASDYDLVITDNQMPRMTGVEMIERLRGARIAVPVIMATGNLPTLVFEHNPWLKPDAMLERPFTNGDLLEMVEKVLQTDEGNKAHMQTLLPKYL